MNIKNKGTKMYLLNTPAIERLKKDSQLKSLIALNCKCSPQTVDRWIRENNVMLTSYTVLRLVSGAMNSPFSDVVEATGHVYEPL